MKEENIKVVFLRPSGDPTVRFLEIAIIFLELA